MENESIDLKRYLALLKRWVWLLALGALFGAALALGASQLQTPVYRAVTKVMITRGGIADQSLDVYSYYYTDQLSQTYLQLLQTETVLSAASERLGIDLDEVLIDAQAVRDTTIIEIRVEHPSPALAVRIADTLVEVLIEQNEKIQSGRYVLMEESLTTQKAQLESQITSLQTQIEQASLRTITEQEQWIQEQIAGLETEIEALTEEIRALGNPGTSELRSELDQKRARLEQVNLLLPLYQQSYTDLVVYGKQVDAAKSMANSQLALLNTTQALYQQIYANVLSNLESVRLAGLQNTPNVVPIESAALPEDPVRPRKLLNTALGGVVGLMLSTSVLVLKEYLDNTVKSAEDLERVGSSAIGYIAEMQAKEVDETGLYVSQQPRSPIAEAFRSLRTNIEFSAIDKPLKTLLVTSPEPGTGKTTVAANLAVIFAQKGKRVLLLDADLRRPHVHRAMKLQNRIGLTNLLMGELYAAEVSHRMEGDESLAIVTSGSLPPNPAELLGSARMERALAELGEGMDLIVIDSPPSIVADAQVLAAKVDAVLLVVQPGRTLKDTMRATIDTFKLANARIIGVVINRIPRDRGGDYYGRYYFQGYQNTTPLEEQRAKDEPGGRRKPFFRRAGR